MKTNIVLNYEKPNPYLYTFTGTATLKGAKIACDNSNFVLRGCSLRNTEWIYGVIAYTGYLYLRQVSESLYLKGTKLKSCLIPSMQSPRRVVLR